MRSRNRLKFTSMPCRYSGLARLPACRAGPAPYAHLSAKVARRTRRPLTQSRAYNDQAASQQAPPSQRVEAKAPVSKELATVIHANAPYRTLITKSEALILDVLPTQTTEGSTEDRQFWRHLLGHSLAGMEGMETELREGKPSAQLNIFGASEGLPS